MPPPNCKSLSWANFFSQLTELTQSCCPTKGSLRLPRLGCHVALGVPHGDHQQQPRPLGGVASATVQDAAVVNGGISCLKQGYLVDRRGAKIFTLNNEKRKDGNGSKWSMRISPIHAALGPLKLQCWETATCPPGECDFFSWQSVDGIAAINTKASLRATFRCYHRLMPHKISPSQFLKLQWPGTENFLLAALSLRWVLGRNRLEKKQLLFNMLQLTQHPTVQVYTTKSKAENSVRPSDVGPIGRSTPCNATKAVNKAGSSSATSQWSCCGTAPGMATSAVNSHSSALVPATAVKVEPMEPVD